MRSLLSTALVAGVTLGLASLAQAVTLTTFDNFTTASPYAGWASGTVTPGPTALRVQATGFGGAYCDLPDVNASGTDTIQLKATVSAGVAGFVVAVGDTAGHEANYAWYGNPAGDYTLTAPLSSPNFTTGTPGALDLSSISYVHIQVDPGAFAAVPYDVSYNDLQLITVPEPSALLAAGLGGALLRRRRQS